MRILQVIDTDGPGGAEDVLLSLATACVEAAHHCVVVAPDPSFVASEANRRGLPVRVATPTGAFSVRYLRAIVRAIRAERPTVVHAHLLGAGLYASLAGMLTGTPVVLTLHGKVDLGPEERHLWIKKWVTRRVARIITVSGSLGAHVLERLAVEPTRVVTIANGIDTHRFAHARSRDLRAEFGLPADAFVIGSVGNIRAAKAYETGIGAIHGLRARGLNAHWLVAGQADPGGTLLEALRREATRLDVADAVKFVGFETSPERFFASLDCYLLCSRSEGHPLSLCQAMAAGRPVVTTACGIEHLIADGTEGWVVPVDAPDRIAEALATVVHDRREAARRGANARERAVAEFDARHAFTRHFQLYNEVQATPSPATTGPSGVPPTA